MKLEPLDEPDEIKDIPGFREFDAIEISYFKDGKKKSCYYYTTFMGGLKIPEKEMEHIEDNVAWLYQQRDVEN